MPDFTSLAAVKTALGITSDGDDSIITALIPQVTAAFETAMGREFWSPGSDVDEYPRVAGGENSILFVTRWPIKTVTSVWESVAIPRAYDADSLLVADEDYILDTEAGMIHRLGSWWPTDVAAVKVTYDGGYDTAPADLERAAQEVIQVKLQKGKGKLYHLSATEVGDGEIRGIRFDDFPDHVKTILASYREVRL